MGIRSMVQFAVRVAAFTAVLALLLQISCMSGVTAITTATAQVKTHGDSGCHESAPPTPNAPDSSHICCSGDHSPDALLSATVAPVPLISDVGASHLTLPLPSLAIASIDFPASCSPPHGLLPLRI
jgi:hypothetical protein